MGFKKSIIPIFSVGVITCCIASGIYLMQGSKNSKINILEQTEIKENNHKIGEISGKFEKVDSESSIKQNVQEDIEDQKIEKDEGEEKKEIKNEKEEDKDKAVEGDEGEDRNEEGDLGEDAERDEEGGEEGEEDKIDSNEKKLENTINKFKTDTGSQMKFKEEWDQLYDLLISDDYTGSSFSYCSSESNINFKIFSSKNSDKTITDTTKRLWPDKDEKPIFIEILEGCN